MFISLHFIHTQGKRSGNLDLHGHYILLCIVCVCVVASLEEGLMGTSRYSAFNLSMSFSPFQSHLKELVAQLSVHLS